MPYFLLKSHISCGKSPRGGRETCLSRVLNQQHSFRAASTQKEIYETLQRDLLYMPNAPYFLEKELYFWWLFEGHVHSKRDLCDITKRPIKYVESALFPRKGTIFPVALSGPHPLKKKKNLWDITKRPIMYLKRAVFPRKRTIFSMALSGPRPLKKRFMRHYKETYYICQTRLIS